jgi:hypothetical protein
MNKDLSKKTMLILTSMLVFLPTHAMAIQPTENNFSQHLQKQAIKLQERCIMAIAKIRAAWDRKKTLAALGCLGFVAVCVWNSYTNKTPVENPRKNNLISPPKNMAPKPAIPVDDDDIAEEMTDDDDDTPTQKPHINEASSQKKSWAPKWITTLFW